MTANDKDVIRLSCREQMSDECRVPTNNQSGLERNSEAPCNDLTCIKSHRHVLVQPLIASVGAKRQNLENITVIPKKVS